MPHFADEPKKPRSENDDRAKKADNQNEHSKDDELDEGLEGTFPASDPVSVTTKGHAGRPSGKTNEKPPKKR